MKEIVGDIWSVRVREVQAKYTTRIKHDWVVITTNGYFKKNGEAVMGRGIAKQAALKHPSLPEMLGGAIKEYGNKVFWYPLYNILTFPVKHNWWEKADIDLIEESCKQLVDVVERSNKIYQPALKDGGKQIHAIGTLKEFIPKEWGLAVTPPIYMVRPGCGNGGLNWQDVRPVCEKYLDDRFVVVYWDKVGKRRFNNQRKK